MQSAANIAGLLKDENNSLLSTRGMARGMKEPIPCLCKIISHRNWMKLGNWYYRFDTPVRQVLIESRVVFATDNFEDALG